MLKYEKTLIYFLIKHKVIIRFRKNLREHKFGIVRKNVKIKVSRLLRQHPPENYIKSFNWELTKEGNFFWTTINKRWKKELRKHETNPKHCTVK